MQDSLGKPIEHAVDGENNSIDFDVAYTIRGDLREMLQLLRARHGEDLLLLPMSATSSGGGIFQHRERTTATVVGLRYDAPHDPQTRFESNPDLCVLRQDEIVIDRERQKISGGAAVTLNQLNRALADELGHQYRVAGADLTSYMYAAVGATFMTGGMGPQRRYFSDSVDSIALFDGHDSKMIDGDALAGYAGTYGWSGMVTAVCCRYYRFPTNEIGFALPVSSRDGSLARLLEHLAPYCFLDFSDDGVRSREGGSDLILGIEHVGLDSMQPLLNSEGADAERERASKLQQKCEAANADGAVFINGLSDRSIDEFLVSLVDDEEAPSLSIAGIDIDNAEVFGDPEAMRALREAIPYAARTQGGKGRLVYKNHTDATVRMPVNDVGNCVERMWQINSRYVDSVRGYFADNGDVDGQILVYGHLNPFGVDPHNRVTMSSDDEAAFDASREFLLEQRAIYYRDLAELCARSAAEFIGGEKTADSEIAIYRALRGPQNAPGDLPARFLGQQQAIARAERLFNWRAPAPYR